MKTVTFWLVAVPIYWVAWPAVTYFFQVSFSVLQCPENISNTENRWVAILYYIYQERFHSRYCLLCFPVYPRCCSGLPDSGFWISWFSIRPFVASSNHSCTCWFPGFHFRILDSRFQLFHMPNVKHLGVDTSVNYIAPVENSVKVLEMQRKTGFWLLSFHKTTCCCLAPM